MTYVFLNFCLGRRCNRSLVHTQSWHFIVSPQILRLAELWQRAENSWNQQGKEVLRDYLTDVSTTNIKQPFVPQLFSLSRTVQGRLIQGRNACWKVLCKSQIFQAILPFLEVARDSWHLCCDQMDQEKACAYSNVTLSLFSVYVFSCIRRKASNSGRWRWCFCILLPCQTQYRLYALPEKDPRSKADRAPGELQKQMSGSALVDTFFQFQDTKPE